MDAVFERILGDLQKGKFSHAVLIDGGSEQARVRLAYDIAQAVVCTGENQPCGICAHCIKAAARTHPDILFYSGGDQPGSFKVDTIREIRQSAAVLPNEAVQKVYILHNAQGMAPAAQNALLKILEEPPRFVQFILTCPSHAQLLQTILSRVTVYSIFSDDLQEDSSLVKASTELAEKILLAVCNRNEAQILRLTAAFEGDKSLFSACCSRIHALAAQSIIGRYSLGLSDNPVAAEISGKISDVQLLQIQKLCLDTIENIQNNINNNLLMTYFSARLSAEQDGRN